MGVISSLKRSISSEFVPNLKHSTDAARLIHGSRAVLMMSSVYEGKALTQQRVFFANIYLSAL